MTSLLIVDDEPDILETTRWAFETVGYQVYTAGTAEEGLQLFETSRPQLLLIDYKLPAMSGADLLKAARAIDPTIPAIMITGLTHQSEAIEAECQRLGTFRFLKKPLKMSEVLQIVKEAVCQRISSSQPRSLDAPPIDS